MSSAVEEISDLSQLVKILNDIKEYFPNINNEEEDGEHAASATVDWILSYLYDRIEEFDDDEGKQAWIQENADSSIFAFNDQQKERFIRDINNQVPLEGLWQHREIGAARLKSLLDMIVRTPVTLSCSDVYSGSVARYKLELKPGIKVSDIFEVCNKFTEHDMHSIDSFVYLEPNTIIVNIDEST